MDKSIHSRRYTALLMLLREVRSEAGVTQVELAARLGETQTFVSKCERGERRIDVVELRTICQALGTSLPSFVMRLEKVLDGVSEKRTRSGSRSGATRPIR